MKRDFDFVSGLIEEFITQKKVIEKFNIIEDKKITGWEIWFQIEFASFLSNHIMVGDWFRECPIAIDGRKEKIKSKIIVDFLIRKKNYMQEKYIALEIKQNKSIDTCLSKMIEDLIKVKKRKPSSTKLRSFWSIGIHPTDEVSKIEDKIEKKQYEKNFELDKYIVVKQIKNSTFAHRFQ